MRNSRALQTVLERPCRGFEVAVHGSSANFIEAHQRRACLQAAFLLPWRRIFNLSDSQLYVAKRENAKALFRGHIESKGGILQVQTLPHLMILLMLCWPEKQVYFHDSVYETLQSRVEVNKVFLFHHSMACRHAPEAESGAVLCRPTGRLWRS